MTNLQKQARRIINRYSTKREPSAQIVAAGDDAEVPTLYRKQKLGRNDTCPCGSGKKVKNCCGINIKYDYKIKETQKLITQDQPIIR